MAAARHGVAATSIVVDTSLALRWADGAKLFEVAKDEAKVRMLRRGLMPIFEPGLEGLAKIRAFSRHLLVGIGGLNAGNAQAVVMAGADGIAVVSAICTSPDPFKASRELDDIIRTALAKRGRLSEK